MRNPLRRAVALVCVFATTSLLTVAVAPQPASAEDPPAPVHACDLDNDGVADTTAEVDALLAGELGSGHSISDFTSRWVDRLRGVTPIGGLTLDQYLDRDTLPDAVANEGYHGLDESVKHCLAGYLYDALVALGEPGFPHPSLTPEAAKALLYSFVFDNQWVKDAQQGAGPPTPPPAPPPVTDAVDALLAGLKLPPAPTLPSVSIPPDLNPVPLVLKTADELQAGLLNPVNQLFTNVGNLISQLGLPVTLPIPKLPAIDVASLINLTRRVVDSTTYRVCYSGGKWGTSVRCGTLAQPKDTDQPVALGTPVPVDLAGDARPDATAQLVPQVNNNLGVGYEWKVTRLSAAASGVKGPIPAHVFAIFTVPTNDLQLSVGSDGTPSTLAQSSNYTFTLTDAQKAAQGEINLAVRIVHTNPGSKSGISFGASPLTRDAGNLGTSSSTSFDTGTLTFSPVPASTSTVLSGGSQNPIDAAIQLKTGDLDGDQNGDSRAQVGLTMPQAGVVLDARVLSKLPPAEGAECCPFREITTTVNAIPTSVNMKVDSFPAKRVTDATYDANATIGQVDFAAKMFADTDGDYPTGADANTFSKVTAKVQQIPTHVHVNYTAPDAATPAKTHLVHYDANAGIQHAEFASEQWAHDAAANASAKQRRLFFGADTIPSVIDLTATTTEVTSRNSTGQITYQANGNVTNVNVDSEDVIGLSQLIATVASLPKAIDASYDIEQPADTNPAVPGFEDPGHTVVHVDGRNLSGDPAGSASFGQMHVKFRSRVSDFLVPDPAVAPEEHALVNMDPRNPSTPLDDTTQVDLRYSGLRLLDAEVLENGRIAATIRNDAEKKFVAQVSKPDLRISSTIDKLPKQVTFARDLVGGAASHQHVTYTGCTPSGIVCTPKKIDSVKVRLDGVIPASSLPNGAPKPSLLAGEFVDATISDVPDSVTVDLDTPDQGKQTVTYDASTNTGKITAALRKGVTDMGTVNVAAEVSTIPTHFDATYGKDLPITFANGGGQAVGEVRAAVTNTGQALVPTTFSPHAAATYIETPNQLPQLQASLGLKNLQAFSFDSGAGDGSFTGSIKTAAVSPNPNSPFTIAADVRTLAEDAAGNKIDDLDKATVIRTGAAGMVMKPLPTNIVISKQGGVQPGGSDTSTLTIDTTGAAEKAELVADVAIGGPDGVVDALAESLLPVQGVHVGDGAAPGESDAIRLVLSLAQTPTKSVVRYGQIALKTAMPANPSPAFDISGFGTLPGDKLTIAIDQDDVARDDRLHAGINVGGVGPALGFLKFFPIALNPNAEHDLDLEVRSAAGNNGGALDLDLRFGEDESAGAARPNNRIVVHTDALPAGVLFQGKLGVAAAPDLANFHGEFRDAAGALTQTPGHTTVQYQTPAEDGVNLDQTPPSKVTLDLKDVPSKVDFTVKTAASIKKGNPNETCGLKESDFVLPTIVYTSDGANKNSLDAAVGLDLSFIKPGAPNVTLELVDLANNFTITNTDEGKTYNLGNAGGATGKVLVKVDPFDVTLVDLDWTGCPSSDDLISWEAHGRATVRIKPEKLRLETTGLQQVQLKPGFSTGVDGTFGTLSLSLPNPMFQITFSDGFFGGIKIHLSDDIEGTIPVLSAPDGTVGFPLPVVFHVAAQSPGEWFDVNTFIPCPVPPFFLHAVANIEPHRVALSTNSFTVTNGTWTVTADPFGLSAGLSYLFGIDIIDTIAGLFTSPYDHGIRSPSVECELF